MFVSFLTLAFLLNLIYTRQSLTTVAAVSAITGSTNPPLSKAVVRSLTHYSSYPNNTECMLYTDIKQIVDVLRQCQHPCNLLVFSLIHETFLWKALNHNGRTVFIDENIYYASYIEEKYPEIETYDV